MKTLTPWHIDLIPWYVLAAYWAISALRVKRTKAAERSTDRLMTLAVMVGAFVLLFDDRLKTGPLELRFVPADTRIAWVGVVITSIGVAIAIWARSCTTGSTARYRRRIPRGAFLDFGEDRFAADLSPRLNPVESVASQKSRPS